MAVVLGLTERTAQPLSRVSKAALDTRMLREVRARNLNFWWLYIVAAVKLKSATKALQVVKSLLWLIQNYLRIVCRRN